MRGLVPNLAMATLLHTFFLSIVAVYLLYIITKNANRYYRWKLAIQAVFNILNIALCYYPQACKAVVRTASIAGGTPTKRVSPCCILCQDVEKL